MAKTALCIASYADALSKTYTVQERVKLFSSRLREHEEKSNKWSPPVDYNMSMSDHTGCKATHRR